MSGCGKEIDSRSVREMPQRIEEKAEELNGEQRVVVLACRWRYCAGKDIEGLKKLAEQAEYRMVVVPCSGLVSADWVVRALDHGVDAVLVLGGHPRNCPFKRAVEEGEEKLRSRIERQGYEPDRLVTDWTVKRDSDLEEVVGELMESVDHIGRPFR
jgi:F420-non-reducing hydrogenase iron-sulfur subunit